MKRNNSALILLGLLVMAALGTLAMGGQDLLASSSPLQSPLPTYEYFPSPIDGPLPPTVYWNDPRYSPIPAPTAEPPAMPACCEGWWRLEDWMGIYPLWTDGAHYTIGEE